MPFLTDQGQTRDLAVVLPAGAGVGAYDLGGLDARYAENRWWTDQVDGEVQVVDAGDAGATVWVDAVADRGGLERRVRGQVVVRRGHGPRCAP